MISLEEFTNLKESLIIFQNEEIIFSSFDSDIIPLVKFLGQKKELSGKIIIFDKYVGRAAGLLMTKTSPSFIYTPMISENAVNLFIEYEIDFEATKIVKYLMGEASNEMCQWEKLSIGKCPDEFYLLAKEKLTV
ncbi:MAG: hypothetical protein DRP35_00990 [Candidatus Zixiibacteriota bacterium]|nr:MAG: hypothetical protein DRP35_00990 [candidate division Zixibacteria bacterium]